MNELSKQALRLTPELEAELKQLLEDYKRTPEDQARLDAFSTSIHDSTWIKVLP